jgi:hypothetical protein
LALNLISAAKQRASVLSVHARDIFQLNLFRTSCFTAPSIGASAEAFFVVDFEMKNQFDFGDYR